MEGDGEQRTMYDPETDFNPLPPGGGRLDQAEDVGRWTNFNPLPPGGGRPFDFYNLFFNTTISIHSLRVEGDAVIAFQSVHGTISIHSLRVEGDRAGVHGRASPPNFNPLPPGGGRLPIQHHVFSVRRNFNPLPPGGGRQG